MYAGDLLDQLQWDTLYHEHLTFYSLGTLGGLLGRYGFEPISALRIPMHGGSLRLAAARTGHRPADGSVADLQAWEGGKFFERGVDLGPLYHRLSSADRCVRRYHATPFRWRVDLGDMAQRARRPCG